MKYIVITYKSRNNLMMFERLLKSNGVGTQIVNTPHIIASSCSLSLKCDMRYLNLVCTLVRQADLSGFLGVYLINNIIGQTQKVRIM